MKNSGKRKKICEMVENDVVELSRVDDNIVIKKANNENKMTLDQIFGNYDGQSTVENYDWGVPVGKEYHFFKRNV